MHALRHVHDLLVPDGTLVELHPLTEEELTAADGPLGRIEEPQFVGIDLPNAEARLAEAVAAGLYVLEAETEFDFLQHYEEPGDVLEARKEALATQPALVERIRAATPPIVGREHVVLRRLRARR